jgi:hypothetical protein
LLAALCPGRLLPRTQLNIHIFHTYTQTITCTRSVFSSGGRRELRRTQAGRKLPYFKRRLSLSGGDIYVVVDLPDAANQRPHPDV